MDDFQQVCDLTFMSEKEMSVKTWNRDLVGSERLDYQVGKVVHNVFSNTHTNYGLCVLTKTLHKYEDLKLLK